MSSSASAHIQALIAHYLAENYPSVLPSFLGATGAAAPDPSRPPTPDLRTLVADYASAQLARTLAATAIADGQKVERATDGSWRGWTLDDMIKNNPLSPDVSLSTVVRTLDNVSAANLLAVAVTRVPRRVFDTSRAAYVASYPRSILTSSVDRTLKIIDYESGEVDRILEPHRAAILTFAIHPTNPRYLVTGSMDGTTILTDLVTATTLQTVRSDKFVVRVAFSPDGLWLATASYDHNVVVYAVVGSAHAPPAHEDDMPLDDSDDADLALDPTLRLEERHRVRLEANPESILFHPASTWLMYTVRGSHLLHYVRMPGAGMEVDAGAWETTSKSFNPHPMDSHVSFAVLDLALHPSGKLVACLTGDHRGGAGERVLIYGVEPDDTERLACLWTGSESDDFVLPRVAWLPDGTAVVTTTPTGHLNLVSLAGERRSSLKVHGAIELGQGTSDVVRDCVVVALDDEVAQGRPGQWEVVSVGYDRRVRISR